MANNRGNLVAITTNNIVDTDMGVAWVFDIEQVTSLLSVVLAAEENIDFFECDVLGLRDEEPDEEGQTYVTRHEEEERITTIPISLGFVLEKWMLTYSPQLA